MLLAYFVTLYCHSTLTLWSNNNVTLFIIATYVDADASTYVYDADVLMASPTFFVVYRSDKEENGIMRNESHNLCSNRQYSATPP